MELMGNTPFRSILSLANWPLLLFVRLLFRQQNKPGTFPTHAYYGVFSQKLHFDSLINCKFVRLLSKNQR
jgi:hypothetical protein